MRGFAAICKDTETKHTMVLADASYNMACDWLQRKQRAIGRDVFRVDHDDSYHMTLYTGRPVDGYDMNGQPDKFYAEVEKYYYDELRGYLMCD